MTGQINDTTNAARAELRNLEQRICDAVNSVHGFVTAQENGRLEILRAKVGERFDAINRKWLPLEDR